MKTAAVLFLKDVTTKWTQFTELQYFHLWAIGSASIVFTFSETGLTKILMKMREVVTLKYNKVQSGCM